MTQEEILDHPEYYNNDFNFPDEEWIPIVIDGYSRYKQSNYYRVMNKQSGKIIKPQQKSSYKKYIYSLYNDNNISKHIRLERLFSDFNLLTRSDYYLQPGFIAGAF